MGGSGYGRLTDKTITKHGNYYRKAIKDHPNDVKGMKSAILSILYHAMSTDKKPQHFKCPEGPESCCFYNRMKAKNETPGSHKLHLGSPLDEKLAKDIIPVYQKMANESLLERCLEGKTQNSNESLHASIWNFVPKTTFVSQRKIWIAVSKAVARKNLGLRKALELELHKSGTKLEAKGENILKKLEKTAEIQKKKRYSSVAQEERKRKRLATLSAEARNVEKEGIQYEAGVF